MKFVIEVWGLIFSFLPLNDVIEVSVVCKDFYCGTRKNKFFTKKLSDIRGLNRIERIVSLSIITTVFCVYPINYPLT